MGISRPHGIAVRRIRRGRLGVWSVLLILVVASCGSGGTPSGATETADGPADTNPATEPVGQGRPEVVLFDFVAADASQVTDWTTVNDPVMGGMSTSEITADDGGLVFSGTISLQNNGGFASIRGPEDPDIGRRASGAESIRVHARGDGQTYLVKLGVTGQPWSYIQRFSTVGGVERVYQLPIAGFEPVGMRLRPAPEAPRVLDPATISRVSVYILDKQQGRFELTIKVIGAA